jgi:hypothetical protein
MRRHYRLPITLAFTLCVCATLVAAQERERPGEGDGSPRAVREPDHEIGVLTCNLQVTDSEPETAAPSTEGQSRAVLCSFKPKAGSEESYVGTIRGLVFTQQGAASVTWIVKAQVTSLSSGSLEQSYAPDSATAADQPARLVGENDASIVLRTMADKPEGSASAKEKPKIKGLVVLGLELRLKGATA